MRNFLFLLCTILILSSSNAFASAPHEGMNMSHDTTEPLKNLSGKDFEAAFYSMMIPHHQAAVGMSEKILESTQDPEVEKWAKSIIEAQSKEIDFMQKALENVGGLRENLYLSMEADMAEMLSKTQTDKDFVELMIPHHESAIKMAELVKDRTKTPEILALAHSILTTQQEEIDEFRTWLMVNKAN